MSCKIEYIEKSDLSSDVKSALTKAHIDIANDLFSHRWNNPDKTIGNRIFTYHPNSHILTVGSDPLSKYNKEAQIKIASLNKKYLGFLPEHEDQKIVRLVPVPDNEYLQQVVIDVRRSALVDFSKRVSEEPTDSNLMYLLEEFNRSAITQHTDEFFNMVVKPLKNHDVVFDEILNSVENLLLKYLKSNEGDIAERGTNLKHLRELRKLLKNKDDVSNIKALSKYIIMSGWAVSHVQNKIYNITEDLKNLPNSLQERQNAIADISTVLKQASYYYHLFAPLEDISLEFLKNKVNPNPMDNYYRDVLEKNLVQFMEVLSLPNEVIDEILNSVPERISDPNLIYNDIVNSVLKINPDANINEFLRGEFERVLEKSENPYKSLHNQLINNVNSFKVFQNDIKNLHYDVIGEMLYPVMEHVFEGKTQEFKNEAIDKKWLLSKEDFKTYLQVADKDISSISFWLSAPINTNDLLAKTTSLYLKQIQIYADIQFKRNAEEIQDFLVKNKVGGGKKLYELTNEQQKEINNSLVFDALVIDNFTPVMEDYPGESIDYTIMGVTKKYPARKSRFYIGEFDVLSYNNEKGAFMNILPEVVSGLVEKLKSGYFGLRDLENSDGYLRQLHDELYYQEGEDWISSPNFKKAIDDGYANNYLRRILQSKFYKDNLIPKSSKERNEILIRNNIVDRNGKLNEINQNSLNKISSRKRYNEGSFSWMSVKNPESLVGFTTGEKIKFLVKLSNGKHSLIDVDSKGNPNLKEGETIDYIYYNSGESVSLSDKWHATKSQYSQNWSRVNSRDFLKNYYNLIYSTYKKSNDLLGEAKLRYREIQQVQRPTSKLDKVKNIGKNINNPEFFIKGVMNYGREFLIEQDSEPLKDINGNYIDEDGNILPTGAPPVYVSRVGMQVDGTQKRSVPMRYRLPVPTEELDEDLYRSVLMFNMAAEQYSVLNKHKSTAQLIGTLINGDTKLKIDPRKVGVIDEKGNPTLQAIGGKLFTKNNPRVTDMLNKLINDTFYNAATPDFNLGGLSTKKIVEQMTGLTSYMSLAWNVSTMIPNYSISLINERSVSVGNKFWNKKMFDEAVGEYWKAVTNGDFLRDFQKKGLPIEKSFLTQLLIMFDGLQGEFLSPTGKIESTNLAEKLMDNALFWTMESVEHANQLQSMVMLLKGHKIKDSEGNSISLWKAIKDANVNRKEGERVVLPEYFSTQQQIDFRNKLAGVNRVVHGNYSKLDKNMLQHSILGPMVMTFRKWIYDGFRTRFQNEDYDWEIQDSVEGYFSSYLKDLNKEFFKIRKENGWKQALLTNGWKSIPMSLVKTTLSGIDAITGRLASSGSDTVHKFLYGEGKDFYQLPEDERKLLAMHRASYEIGMAMILMIVATGISAAKDLLDDDDEVAKEVLSFLEVQSRRISNDIGFFSSFTNFGGGEFPGMLTLDQFLRITKDPMVSYRTVDATAGILSHLTDFGYGDEGFHWGVFDQYQRDGNSYEKGDYKIVRKIEKSIIAPYWQIIKLLNPEDQLKYMDMAFKYSK